MNIHKILISYLGSILRVFNFKGKTRCVDLLGKIFSRVSLNTYYYINSDKKITLCLSDRIERLIWGGCYENELIRILNKFLKPGMCFMDIGANIGYFSYLASDLVDHNGKIFAFEPDPYCYSRLKNNSENFKNLNCYCLAISDKIGERIFYRSPVKTESGWGSLFNYSEDQNTINVSSETLDNWILNRSIEKVDFVKIDVEGAEFSILNCATLFTNLFRPIYYLEENEICLARAGKSANDLLMWFEKNEYYVNRILDSKYGYNSILAVPKENKEFIFDMQTIFNKKYVVWDNNIKLDT